MNEEWRDVPDYEGYYQVSNLGRIKSLTRTYKRKNHNGEHEVKVRERIIRTRVGKNGYAYFVACKPKQKDKTLTVHRLVGLTFLKDSYFEGAIINHINGVRDDNRPENIEWVDYSQNSIHGIMYGNHKTGSECNWAKLTKEDVDFIRENYEYRGKVWNTCTLAEKFGVDRRSIGDIVNHRRWKKYDDYK